MNHAETIREMMEQYDKARAQRPDMDERSFHAWFSCQVNPNTEATR